MLRELFGLPPKQQFEPLQIPNDPFSLEYPLLRFSSSNKDVWKIRDACEGTQVFGATGSGKTSGSGKSIAHAFLQSGFGGLVLCAKPDEKDLWLQYARETGRTDSVIVFNPQNQFRFNFLNYELNRPSTGGGLTENLVSLFYTIIEISDRKGGTSSSGDYWERALKQLLRNTIDLLVIAKGHLSLTDMYEVVISAPQSIEDLQDDYWRSKSACFRAIREAKLAEKSASKEQDLEFTLRYWLNEFPTLADRTRSIIVSSFTSMADCFLRGVLRELFCTQTNVFPELTHEGAIIILDLPVKGYQEIGLIAQVLWKYLFQQATERRNIAQNPRPVFLWADEAQLFLTSHDTMFQTTARSSRCSSVYLTQNISNYYAVLPVGKARDEANSLLANLQTKIFHANTGETNEYASNLFAKNWQMKTSFNASVGETKKPAFLFDEVQSSNSNQSYGHTESLEFEVQPIEFTRLKKGGSAHNFEVEAFIFQGGRIFDANGKNYLKVTFDQKT